MIDRNRFGVGIEIGKLGDQAGPRMPGFTHAHDTAAAHIYSRVTDFLQSIQTILVSACSYNFAIKLRRRIEVVVVIIKPCLAQLVSLPWLQHTQRGTGFKSERLY